MDTPSTVLRVRELRVRHGMSQTELAEAAGLDLRTLRAVELDPDTGNAKLATLHRIARVLGVTTGALFTPPHPDVVSARHDVHQLRALLEPPPPTPEAPERKALNALLREADLRVRDNDIDNAVLAIALLIPHARAAVDAAPSPADRRAASSVLVRGYDRMAAVLTVVGEHELALKAADLLEQVAQAESEPMWAAGAVAARSHPLMRQGRFTEVISQAEAAAAHIEPSITTQDDEQVAMWGRLMRWISGAAARDNQPDAAADAIRRAGVAAAILGSDRVISNHSMGPTAVAIRKLENAVVAEDFGLAKRLLNAFPRDGRVLPKDRHRHALDVANVAVESRQPDRAIEILCQLRDDAPAWLQSQPYATAIGTKLVKASKRRLTPQVRELADFLSVPA
jgi:transcriptional regulator with XRE-family HTH domain